MGVVIGGVLIYAVASGGFAFWVAEQKGRPGGAWFFLGFCFGILALLAVGLAPAASRSHQGEPDNSTSKSLLSGQERGQTNARVFAADGGMFETICDKCGYSQKSTMLETATSRAIRHGFAPSRKP